MELHEYESRLNRPIMMKIPEFQRNERLKHVISSEQFDTGLLEHLSNVATMIKNITGAKEGHDYLSSLLSHKRAMLYFTQASTRTFLSFMAACQILGLKCNEIRDPSVSSEYKGESAFDSVRMFSSYFDIIIMRSRTPDFAECCAYVMNDLEEFNQRSVPIINGGAGADEHPTQALLDMFTVRGKKGKIDGLRIAIIGDISHSRVARSNILGFTKMNAQVVVAGPPTLMPPEIERLGCEVAPSLEKAIEGADVVMMLRIQFFFN